VAPASDNTRRSSKHARCDAKEPATLVLNQLDFHELYTMVRALPNWQGTLEDATVILLAQRYHCPVWTLNYRDFGIFKSLEFWNP